MDGYYGITTILLLFVEHMRVLTAIHILTIMQINEQRTVNKIKFQSSSRFYLLCAVMPEVNKLP